MQHIDIATIQALRSDLALQIARFIRRSGQNGITAAKRLSIPQPTVSKILHGKVADVSLELLIRIAVRAGLPVVLQTGKTPAEAGAFVSAAEASEAVSGSRSRLAERAREDLTESARRLTPEQRLEAHVRHSELVTTLHHAGRFGRSRF